MNGGDTTAMAKYTLSFDFSTSFHFLMSTFSRYLRQAKHTIFDLIFDYTFCLPQMDYHSIPAKGGGGCDERKTREQTVRAVETRPFRSKCGREMLESSPATLFYYPRLEHSEKFTCSLQISQSWFLILPFTKNV